MFSKLEKQTKQIFVLKNPKFRQVGKSSDDIHKTKDQKISEADYYGLISSKKGCSFKGALIQRVLMHLSFPQTDQRHYFPELEI